MAPRPTPQGVNHPTFNAAPFDHGLSLLGLYEYHAKNSPTHPVFTYADPATGDVHDVSYAEAWEKIGAVAGIVSRQYAESKLKSTPRSQTYGGRPVIGILAISDTLSYIYLELAILSLGYIAFPLSSRNSPAVTAHLLEKTGVAQLYVSGDAGMQGLAKSAAELLEAKGLAVEVLPMIKPNDWLIVPEGTTPAKVVDIENIDVTVILHSSGTTAFPKPIPITRRGLINLSNIPCFGEVDLAGKRVAAHTNPMFHAMGLATVIWPVSSGAIFSLYAPVLPPAIPTPANFLAAWRACKCDILFCIPVFIEAWARDPANLPLLKALDCIVFSGASVNKAIGDMLVTSGVTLHPFWGSTEVGPATMFIPRDPPPVDEWEYFKFSHHVEFVLEPQDGLPGIFEPIMIPTEIYFPHVTNAERDGRPVFAVGDLLERHPTDPGRWKVFGRKDDQIMLSTAENINPVPIEGILAQDPNIASAIMFGRHRIEPGVLIEPASPVAAEKLEDFKDLIWPTIEKANARSPAYAHIKRNMILIASPEKPLEHTPKGTPRRGVCLRLYEAEIDNLYKTQEEPAPELREFPDRI